MMRYFMIKILFIIFVLFGVALLLLNEQLKIFNLWKECKYDELEKYYEEIVDKQVENSVNKLCVLTSLFGLYLLQEKLDKARNCLQNIEKINSNDNIEFYLNLSYLLIKEKKYDEAENVINSSLDKLNFFTNHYRILFLNNLVEIKYKTNRVEDAKEILDSLLLKDRCNSLLLTTQADLYFNQCDYINAKLSYKKALKFINRNILFLQLKKHINDKLTQIESFN